MDRRQLTATHSRTASFVFRCKTIAFSLRRSLRNVFTATRRFRKTGKLAGETVIAVSESALWNSGDTQQNWILTAGKVQNLRIAAARIHGTEIPAGAVFSFWQHIGNPNFGKGYVVGREIREGCIVPTVAGGLCQLSNALYDAALKAHFDITERHRHTQVIPGSLAEQNRDATVKWNYVDLRFRSQHAFRIEAELTRDQLVVRFKSVRKNAGPSREGFVSRPVSHLNDCYSCGNTICHKHPTGSAVAERTGTTAYVLDEQWPEYDAYIRENAPANSLFLVAAHNSRLVRNPRLQWKSTQGNVRAANRAVFLRSVAVRLAAYRKRNLFAALLQADRNIALRLAGQLPVDCTHVVVSQNLLPFLWQSGALGGRSFDVLMTRLPAELLHKRLDAAHRTFPESGTLNDFRAPDSFVQAENAALTYARTILTPHTEIAEIFRHKAVLLNWQLPVTTQSAAGKRILFPASALGRKGAYEMKRLAAELHLPVTVYGTASEKAGFWENIAVSHQGSFANVGLIVFPAYVEHQPRLLLKAIAQGIPVITTAAAGIPESAFVKVVPVGDYAALKQQVEVFVGGLAVSR